MMKSVRWIPGLIVLVLLMSGCQQVPEHLQVKADLSSRSYELTNQDSQAVNFPADFGEDYLVVGYIYTHCQSVCPAITANLSRISDELKNEENLHFVGISFDPNRDTPKVLRDYMNRFKLEDERFTFLTGNGDTTVVNRLLDKLKVRAWKKQTKDSAGAMGAYMYVHTNRIHLITPAGKVRGSYRGSTVKPQMIQEDLKVLRR